MSQQLHTPRNFIEDIAEVCKHMQEFVKNASEEELSTNVMLQWPIIRGFEILGEASKQLMDTLPMRLHDFQQFRSGIFMPFAIDTYTGMQPSIHPPSGKF